jgi:uncharacterized protein (TIGR02145 family)
LNCHFFVYFFKFSNKEFTMRTQFSKLTLTAGIVLAMALTFSCSSDKDDGGDDNPPTPAAPTCVNTATQFCDVRDSNLYKFVVIGGKTWMAENLNYAVGGKCYGEGDKVLTGWEGSGDDFNPITTTLPEAKIQANCTTYGRLYNWETAMAGSGICPDGWHLPSNAEWNALMKVANPACTENNDCIHAGTKLKAKNGWYDYNEHGLGEPAGNGTDEFGFSALPSGRHTSAVGFSRVGSHGYWWSASEKDASHAYYLNMASDDKEYVSYGSSNDKSSLHSVRCVKD